MHLGAQQAAGALGLDLREAGDAGTIEGVLVAPRRRDDERGLALEMQPGESKCTGVFGGALIAEGADLNFPSVALLERAQCWRKRLDRRLRHRRFGALHRIECRHWR